jgi:hypothetical protein
MEFATNKYKQMVDQGLWKPTKPEPDEDIIALKAELEKLKNSNNSKSKKEWTKAAWKSVAPADGQPKVKSANGKTYHWCPNHKEWTIHTPEECYKASSGEPAAQTQSSNAAPALRLSDALSAVALQD